MKLVIFLLLCFAICLVHSAKFCGRFEIEKDTYKIVKMSKKISDLGAVGTSLKNLVDEVGMDAALAILGAAGGVASPIALIPFAVVFAGKLTHAAIKDKIASKYKPAAFVRLMKYLAISSPFQHKGTVKTTGKQRSFDIEKAEPKTCDHTFAAATYPLLNFLCKNGEQNPAIFTFRAPLAKAAIDNIFSKYPKLDLGEGNANYKDWWPKLVPAKKTGGESTSPYTPRKLLVRYLSEITAKASQICKKFEDDIPPSTNELTFFHWVAKGFAETTKMTHDELILSLQEYEKGMLTATVRLFGRAETSRTAWGDAAKIANKIQPQGRKAAAAAPTPAR